MKMLGNGAYAQETPYTLEAELAHILTHLHETEGEVLDDYQSFSAANCPSTWLPAHGHVPYVYFNRDNGQLCVDEQDADNQYSFIGIRCAVSCS